MHSQSTTHSTHLSQINPLAEQTQLAREALLSGGNSTGLVEEAIIGFKKTKFMEITIGYI